MAQIFRPKSNTIARVVIGGGLLLALFVWWLCLAYARSSYGTGAEVMVEQVVPFSHQHHVGDLGIDCRYCHTTVEHSWYAGIPATDVCMNCHSQMWVGSAMLKPVRDSYQTGQSLTWRRVHNLPGFVYFDHSIHVNKGIGCSSCHGRVDRMPLMQQVGSLLMEWCLECHRQPERHLRPQEEVFNMKWEPPDNQLEVGAKLAKEYKIPEPIHLVSCSVCHR